MDWSPEVAYGLGLLASDGCLSGDGRHIEFTSKDSELVEHIKTCFGWPQRISRKGSGTSGTSKPYFRVQCGNVVHYRWLLSLGLTPHKSLTLGRLRIPDSFFAHFLRGHLDGDGNITTYQDPVFLDSLRLYVRFYSGSQAFLDWLQDTIRRLWCLRGFQTPTTIRLNYAKEESIKLLNHLYDPYDSISLSRKYRIAKPFIELLPAEVVKLANTRASEARAERLEGSTPSLRTIPS